MEQQQKKVEDLTVTELKAVAFDISEQIKAYQRQQSQIYQVLSDKIKEEQNVTGPQDKQDTKGLPESK